MMLAFYPFYLLGCIALGLYLLFSEGRTPLRDWLLIPAWPLLYVAFVLGDVRRKLMK